jgi:hypothetical protein
MIYDTSDHLNSGFQPLHGIQIVDQVQTVIQSVKSFEFHVLITPLLFQISCPVRYVVCSILCCSEAGSLQPEGEL